MLRKCRRTIFALHPHCVRGLIPEREMPPSLFKHVVADKAKPVTLDGLDSSFGAQAQQAMNVYSNVRGVSRKARECVVRLPELSRK